jgi:hypothetical protein
LGKTEILYEKIPTVQVENIQKKKVRFENVYICSKW